MRYRAQQQPEQAAYTFLRDGEVESVINYRALDRQSRSIAAELQAGGQRGDRVLLLYNIAQLLRDARLLRIFEGPTEALSTFLGAMIIKDRSTLCGFLIGTFCSRDCYRDHYRLY